MGDRPVSTFDDFEGSFAGFVRECRVRRGMRQIDLAAMMSQAGWSASTVAWVENGHRRMTAGELQMLCHFLDVEAPSCPLPPKPVAQDSDEVIRKAARRLGLSHDAFRRAVMNRYGRSFERERDARVGTHGSARSQQARRAHATRKILAELRTF